MRQSAPMRRVKSRCKMKARSFPSPLSHGRRQPAAFGELRLGGVRAPRLWPKRTGKAGDGAVFGRRQGSAASLRTRSAALLRNSPGSYGQVIEGVRWRQKARGRRQRQGFRSRSSKGSPKRRAPEIPLQATRIPYRRHRSATGHRSCRPETNLEARSSESMAERTNGGVWRAGT